jgi:hypothetical protein
MDLQPGMSGKFLTTKTARLGLNSQIDFSKTCLERSLGALLNPKRFPPVGEYVRRENLQDFPYHFL